MRRLHLLTAFIIFATTINGQERLSYSLSEAVDYAVQNAFSSINAIRDIDRAEQEKIKTKAMGLPQINGSAEYRQYLKVPTALAPATAFNPAANPNDLESFFFGTEQSANATATLSQLIFDGSYLVALQSAKVYMQISKNAQEKNKQSIREMIINAYGNVLLSEESVLILEKNQESLSKTLNETTQIFNNGLTEEEDVEQLQITLASIESNLARAQRQYKTAKQLLNLAMGIDIEKNIILSDTLESLANRSVSFRLLSSNFDVKQHIDFEIAENNLIVKKLLVKLEKSKNLPTFDAFINYGVNGFSNDFDFFGSDKRWFDFSQFGFNLKVPIFSSFQRRAATQMAMIDVAKSQTELFELEQRLKLNIATARTDYNFFVAELANYRKNLALAERIEKKQQIKYFEGISTSFDLSEAQRQLYKMQQDYLQAMLNVITSKAKLDSALNEPIEPKK